MNGRWRSCIITNSGYEVNLLVAAVPWRNIPAPGFGAAAPLMISSHRPVYNAKKYTHSKSERFPNFPSLRGPLHSLTSFYSLLCLCSKFSLCFHWKLLVLLFICSYKIYLCLHNMSIGFLRVGFLWLAHVYVHLSNKTRLKFYVMFQCSGKHFCLETQIIKAKQPVKFLDNNNN